MYFRSDGVYIKKYDVLKEGYVTLNNGKYKSNSYGFIDKLYDIHRYGKTMDVSYSYIYFYKSRIRTSGEYFLYMGSVTGELIDILSKFKSTTYFGTDFNRLNYEIINEEYIIYNDSKGRNCSLSLYGDKNLISNEFVNFVTEEKETREYKFYPLNDF